MIKNPWNVNWDDPDELVLRQLNDDIEASIKARRSTFLMILDNIKEVKNDRDHKV